MITSNGLSLFTLLPLNKEVRRTMIKQIKTEIWYIIIFSIGSSCLGFLLDLISVTLSSTEGTINDSENYIPVIADISRAVIYLVMLILSIYFPFLKDSFACVIPVIYSISITEIQLAIERFDIVYIRYINFNC